jgi:hypothetical protein
METAVSFAPEVTRARRVSMPSWLKCGWKVDSQMRSNKEMIEGYLRQQVNFEHTSTRSKAAD